MSLEDKMSIEFDPVKIGSISLCEEEEEAVKERNEEEEEEERKEEDEAMENWCSEGVYTVDSDEEEFKWLPVYDEIMRKGERGEDEESIWTDEEIFESEEDPEEEDEDFGVPFDTSVKFPPEWEDDIRKSPQYKSGMLHMVVKPSALETCPPIADSEFKHPPMYRGPRIENLHQKLIARIKSIRESRGYDVVRGVPCFFLGDPFVTVDPQNTETSDKQGLDKIMKFVLKQINSHAQAQGCGKSYKLVVVEKLVLARPNRVQLITFRAKELSDDAAEENMDAERTIQAMVFTGCCCNQFRLLEWRFRPEAI